MGNSGVLVPSRQVPPCHQTPHSKRSMRKTLRLAIVATLRMTGAVTARNPVVIGMINSL